MRGFQRAYEVFAYCVTGTLILFLTLNLVLAIADLVMGDSPQRVDPNHALHPSGTVQRDDLGFEYSRPTSLSLNEMKDAIFIVGGREGASLVAARVESLLAEKGKKATAVVNYAIPGQDAFQSTLLAERLIQAGHHPRLLVFLDSSEADGGVERQARLREEWERAQFGWTAPALSSGIPVLRWVNRIENDFLQHKLKEKIEKRYAVKEAEPETVSQAILGLRESLKSVGVVSFSFDEKVGIDGIQNEILSKL